MADELKAASAAVRTIVAAVAGIRKVSVSEPAGAAVVPCAYLVNIRGSFEERAFSKRRTRHLETIRVLLSRADTDTGEETALSLVDALDVALRADPRLTSTILNMDQTEYQIGYLDVAGIRYRALDLTIDLWIDK